LSSEYEDKLERERERLRDEAAERRRQLDDELENELDRGRQQIRREERERVEEQLEMLKAQCDAANTANDHTSLLLVTLVKQLFPKKHNYLYDIGLRELSLMDLNRQLAPHGVAIVARYRESTRQVRCQLANGHWAQRTVFSLVSVHEVDADAGALAVSNAQESPS
jgi:hypothetical protein